MSEFGDAEPEDAWDPGDPVDELVVNLIHRADLLDATGTAADMLRALAVRVALARTRHLFDADRVRADLLDEDIAFVRGRLDG